MVYKKAMIVCFIIAITMLCLSSVVFATTNIGKNNDRIYTGVMEILIKIQKYSWPVAVIIFVYAMYQYYVIGSEAFEQKVKRTKNDNRNISIYGNYTNITFNLCVCYS